jgi:hypothetical protein
MDFKYVEMMEKAFEPVQEYLDTTEPVEVVGSLDARRFQPYQSPRLKALGGIRMRLDYEIATERFDSPENAEMTKHVGRLMTSQMVNDFADLIENGDKDSTDPLMKAMNGVVKRGQEPLQIIIDDCAAFRYYSKHKKSYEYILFTTIYVEWPPITDDTEF